MNHSNWAEKEDFSPRHISLQENHLKKMLEIVGVSSVDDLIDETVPVAIRITHALQLPPAKSEYDYIRGLRETAARNKVFTSYIGLGYSDCIVPPVVQRNILENPGWYTQYTPYQAEIAQGRLEALLNYQTMVVDLTGMEVANASLLDESTAAAEAMHMLFQLRKNKDALRFFVEENVFPQTLALLQGHAEPIGIEIVSGKAEDMDLDACIFGVLLQYPGSTGAIVDYTALVNRLRDKDIFVAVSADLLSLTLLKPPGEWGADVVVGTSQRFGVPMGFGGPHAAYFATRDEFKRNMPGRIIGVSKDSMGNTALRMALQTREQHIKRDKATSNICTAQALLAIMASMYAVYHGPRGVRKIADRIHGLACLLRDALQSLGFACVNETFFDTLQIDLSTGAHGEKNGLLQTIHTLAIRDEVNFRYDSNRIFIALNETTSLKDLDQIVDIFCDAVQAERTLVTAPDALPNAIGAFERTSPILQHPIFNTHHTEHEMLRYMKSLENKDLSLAHAMIPLGSCTMKLNATTEMLPVTWKAFSNLHPFTPLDQVAGYLEVFRDLEQYLCDVTGFHQFSLQPNSGAQGEYSGLRVIRAYLQDKGEAQRNIVLIPSSAHGTNPASAVMSGFKVVVVACDERGNIDLADLQVKASAYGHELGALMVTYPSTHGVFEEDIQKICAIIHDNGGQVYMDGANMNAQVGLTSPHMIGADVCHLNLHKTFCIPHGGGGPGMGPIGVAKHLAPFLPSTNFFEQHGKAIKPVSEAPWGSASILLISHAYISMMGGDGLTRATKAAIFNANYIKSRLDAHYPVLYAGKNGRCAHELILDCREFKKAGIEVVDIAKRLIDYGFHAPTVSFPVSGTLMIEPTESEALPELDRFCEAMISIRHEIKKIIEGVFDKEDNMLKNSPHTLQVICADQWNHAYTRQEAAFPAPWLNKNKFWASVSRLNETYGDRMFACTCPPISSYIEDQEVSAALLRDPNLEEVGQPVL